MSSALDRLHRVAVSVGIDPHTGQSLSALNEETGPPCPKCGRPASHSGICGYYHTSNSCPLRKPE